jgi:electron transfer flavoprotein alpha subunit
VSYKLITIDQSLVTGDLNVAVVGGPVDTFADDLNREGFDTIHAVAHRDEFNHGVTHQTVVELIEDLQPSLVVIPHSVNELDYAPAVAKTLDVPLVTDLVEVEHDGDRLLATRGM